MENNKTYEGMFLLDAGTPDFEAASEPIRNVLKRSEAEILSIKPWDERRLAFEIQGRKRGLYVLSYFKVDPLKMTEIEHDCNLDERILRSMFLRREKLTDEVINAETPATSHKPIEISEPRAEEEFPSRAPRGEDRAPEINDTTDKD